MDKSSNTDSRSERRKDDDVREEESLLTAKQSFTKLVKFPVEAIFFFHVVGDEAASSVDESMRIVAALFNDGTGKSWYRATVLQRKPGKAKVLFVDHGNVATLPVATHLRPLDVILGTNRIPPVAKEAALAAIKTRGLDDDDGLGLLDFF
jgi:staphylococcal nuclease domain-containing protein 1